MQLIVESGATKTKWLVLNEDQVMVQKQSQGLSPYFQTSECTFRLGLWNSFCGLLWNWG
jgi:hypothetical protein